MTDEMDVLRRDYLPEELAPLLQASGFGGTIAVQARQTLQETEWLLQLADQYPFIRGVIGWVDLQSPSVAEQLNRFSRHPKFCGVRHVVHDEPDDDFMLRPAFLEGLAKLAEYQLTYDLLLFPRHLPVANKVVRQFPEQKFVLDHIAKPLIREHKYSPWKQGIEKLARHPLVYCKLSGMATEASWQHWTYDDFLPYLDIVFNAFGTDRVMIGSDWPVCTLAGDYASVMQIVLDYVQRFPIAVQQHILSKNCRRCYGLN